MPEATSRPVNPLVLKSVKCPLCGTTARQGRLKSSLFVPGPPDFDLRPHGYRRQAPGLEAVHPSAHFLWYCPGCHHAADPARFQDPAAQTGLTLAHVREAFLAHTQGEGPGRRVTLRLAEGLGEGPRDFLAAARVYLLAANQLQAIPEVAQREARVLGRYLVRYAWLLRERDQADVVAARAGAINLQTSWVLKRLELEPPLLLNDASPRFGSVSRHLDTTTPDSPLREAWAIASRTWGVAPIVSDNGKPFGMFSGSSLFAYLSGLIGVHSRRQEMRIAEILDLTVDAALDLFTAFPAMTSRLQTLQDVGLGYVRLGQPAPTLSGGEAQRVKLARELSRRATGRTLYVLDEPSVGLHAADVHKLIEVLQRLVDAGNSVLIIEHNLDIIKVADYLIDLGPEGGDRGGLIIAEGTPEQVCAMDHSYTGQYLRPYICQGA